LTFISEQHASADLSMSFTTFSSSSFMIMVLCPETLLVGANLVPWSHDILRCTCGAGNGVAVRLEPCSRPQSLVDPGVGHESPQEIANAGLDFGPLGFHSHLAPRPILHRLFSGRRAIEAAPPQCDVGAGRFRKRVDSV